MKITSKTLYQELRVKLAPLLKANGFKVAKGGRLGWAIQRGEKYLSIWFQADKWGWDDIWGSKFTLEFQLSPTSDGSWGHPESRSTRIGHLLEGFPELDEIRRINNQVIENLPGTKNNQVVMGKLHDGSEYIAVGYKTNPLPAIYASDIWMNYYSIDDVRQWATFFESKLLFFVNLFENEIKSEQGKANDRFQRMMCLVQSTKEPHSKIQIFEHFINNESDPTYRANAENWLRTLKERVN